MAQIISVSIQLIMIVCGCFATMLFTARTVNIIPVYKRLRCKEATEKNLSAYMKCRNDLLYSCCWIGVGVFMIAIACLGDTTAFFTKLLY